MLWAMTQNWQKKGNDAPRNVDVVRVWFGMSDPPAASVDPGLGRSGGNFVNVPDDMSWKCKAYTLSCSACRATTFRLCTHVETLKAPQATNECMPISFAGNVANWSTLCLSLPNKCISCPKRMHKAMYFLAKSSLPKQIMLMDNIASEATVKSVGIVSSASSKRCADLRNASDNPDVAGFRGPKVHCPMSMPGRPPGLIWHRTYTGPE